MTTIIRHFEVTGRDHLRSLLGGVVFNAVDRFNGISCKHRVTLALAPNKPGRVVGVHCYKIEGGITLRSLVTWVSPTHRRDGVALTLWRASTERAATHGVQRAKLYACTRDGVKFAQRLQELIPSFEFDITTPWRFGDSPHTHPTQRVS